MEPWKQAEVAYEDAIADTYDFHYYGAPIPKAHLRAFVSLIRRYTEPHHLVLDLGGGTGAVTERLEASGYRRIITADLSVSMLREAKKKMPAMNAVVCDGEHLPFKDDAFQTIICSSMLHHLAKPELVLAEVRRTLGLYGVVVAQEPCRTHYFVGSGAQWVSDHCMAIMHYFYRIEHYQPVSEPPVHEYHRAFTRQEVIDLFLGNFFVLEFRSRFAFSCLFSKLRSPALSRAVLALDRTVERHEGSVFHVVCSKSDWGHRNIVRNYVQWVDQLRRAPDERLPFLFVLCLLPLIAAGRLYELYARVVARVRNVVR
jgi:ubiquinone/menaquinone biosynthesis C-methylase UbiE